jgi:hypothetical protein
VIELARELLAAVVGGDTSERGFSVPLFSLTNRQTDYSRCVDQVVAQTAQQYPSTWHWYWPFGSDRNATPRAQATMDNMRRVCGLPPS